MVALARECSIARTLEVVGLKWTLLVVRELMLGVHRFDQIARNTGAPRDVLTDRLRKLEDNGLVERVRYEDRPPRYEYRLTATGQALGPVLSTLREFGDRHLAEGRPVSLTVTHSCGHDFHPVLTCGACGEVADPRDLRIEDPRHG